MPLTDIGIVSVGAALVGASGRPGKQAGVGTR
jgi:hypothetical protein